MKKRQVCLSGDISRCICGGPDRQSGKLSCSSPEAKLGLFLWDRAFRGGPRGWPSPHGAKRIWGEVLWEHLMVRCTVCNWADLSSETASLLKGKP